MVTPCWARVPGPLEPYAAGLRPELERLGYTPLSAAGHVRLVAHLSRWMAVRDVAASGLTLAVVARMPEIGYKFERRLDLVLMQRILEPAK